LANNLKTVSLIESFIVGLHTHSFTHFGARFSLGESHGAAALGGPEIPHDQQHAISNRSAVSTPRRDQARTPPLSSGCRL